MRFLESLALLASYLAEREVAVLAGCSALSGRPAGRAGGLRRSPALCSAFRPFAALSGQVGRRAAALSGRTGGQAVRGALRAGGQAGRRAAALSAPLGVSQTLLGFKVN